MNSKNSLLALADIAVKSNYNIEQTGSSIGFSL